MNEQHAKKSKRRLNSQKSVNHDPSNSSLESVKSQEMNVEDHPCECSCNKFDTEGCNQKSHFVKIVKIQTFSCVGVSNPTVLTLIGFNVMNVKSGITINVLILFLHKLIYCQNNGIAQTVNKIADIDSIDIYIHL